MNRILSFCFVLLLSVNVLKAENYELSSPDRSLKIVVNTDGQLTYFVEKNGIRLLSPTKISMEIAFEGKDGKLTNNKVLGDRAVVSKVNRSSVNSIFDTPVYKKKSVEENYNQMILKMKGNWSLVLRAYDDGVAYRFVIEEKKPYYVINEVSALTFPDNYVTYASYSNRHPGKSFEKQFNTSFENIYDVKPVTELNKDNLIFLPVLVDAGKDGYKMVFTESDQYDYPGMFLNNSTSSPEFTAIFAPVVKVEEQGGHNNLQMMAQEFHDYIAYCSAREFPWRTLIVSSEDKELLNSDMTYKLASPSRVADVSWIKPGKVAWDWWNAWNIEGVDFVSGINTQTYKFYIDFASKYGVEYVILDEGWAVNKMCDLFSVVPEIDLKEIISYAEGKNVGIILWAGYWAYRRDMEEVTRHYSEMGVKGFKIDFMDRDDQDIMKFLYEAADVCAKYNMLIDYHGVCKPMGLQRTYPNVINFEGVMGLEQLKWKGREYDQVTYDVQIPFIRMVAGPMDYTQGAMKNVIRNNYYPSYTEPMSQGTRCRQLAEYVIFESPLNMLCDAPTNYMKEPQCTKFIADIPTVWDDTYPMDSKLSEYVMMARRSGDVWYVGGMTNWDKREFVADLSFLPEGEYVVELFRDGVNAHKKGSDYKRESFDLSKERKIRVNSAPGGGFAAIIRKK